jgi:hypothetical protein
MPIEQLSDLVGRELLRGPGAVLGSILIAEAPGEHQQALREIPLHREILDLVGGLELQIKLPDLVVVLVRVLVLLEAACRRPQAE